MNFWASLCYVAFIVIAWLVSDCHEKKKKIRKMTDDYNKLSAENKSLREDYDMLAVKTEMIMNSLDHTPEGCLAGKWCESCQFSKMYITFNRYEKGYHTVYTCARDGACENYIEKERKNG